MSNEVNWDDFKCRCSGINKILSNSRSNPQLTEKQTLKLIELEAKEILSEKQEKEVAELLVKRQNSTKLVLSDTCIEYLMEVYSWATTGKVAVKKEMDTYPMEKGKLVEVQSITLLSVIDGVLYFKNNERVTNDYLSGEPDIFVGENIMSATKITDIKSCYDYPSFLKKLNVGIDNGWEEQVQGYMDITKAPEGEIAHCLVDTPEIMIMDIKKRIFYKGDYVTEESPDFLEKWNKLERSMTFGDIPMAQRVYKIPVEPFSNEKRQQVYDRVKICREWLWKFHEMYMKLNSTSNPELIKQ